MENAENSNETNKKTSLGASNIGKWKTFFQDFSIILLLLSKCSNFIFSNSTILTLKISGNIFILISLFLSVFSAVDYLIGKNKFEKKKD